VELLEFETGKWFSECIHNHVVHLAVKEVDVTLPVSDGLTNEMKMHIDMLCAAMEGRVL
jgi:hypothetical protein